MTTQRKGRAGKDQTANKVNQGHAYYNSITSGLKAFVVRAALWGIFPVGLAQWINGLGGGRDE